MESLFNRRRASAASLFDMSHLEPHVLTHLQRVYACLSMGLVAAAAGAYLSTIVLPMYGLGSSLLSIGLLLYLHATRDDLGAGRHAVFAAFCGLAGVGLSPLIGLAIEMDPSIVVSAVMTTVVISLCFTLAVLLSKQSRALLYLAGPLMSGLTLLLLLSLFNVFFRSELVFGLTLKLTLVLFSLFLLYDTQKVVELARTGDKDYIAHCIDLFLDVIELFRVVLVLMMRSQQSERSSEQRKKRKD